MNKQRNAIICILVGILLISTVVSFRTKDSKEAESKNVFYSFTDSLGNEVVLTEKPQRVAVLFSSHCNVWKNAGGEASVTVGESVERGFCTEDTLLVDSGAGKSINTELLISYEPDLVIYSSDVPAQKECAKILQTAGIPSAGIRLDSFEDYLYALRIFCDITEKEENFTLFGENIKNEVDAIKRQALTLKKQPKILFIRSGSSQSSCKAKKADDNFSAKMLEELGCFNIADSAPVLLDSISSEAVLTEKPEYIFISLMGNEEASKAHMEKTLMSEPWKSLEGKIVYLPKELFQYKPCEKWAAAYQYLYDKLYA